MCKCSVFIWVLCNFVCLCVHICVLVGIDVYLCMPCVFAYVGVDLGIYLCLYVHVYVHALCVCLCGCWFTCVCVCKCMYVYMLCSRESECMCISGYAYVCVGSHTLVYMCVWKPEVNLMQRLWCLLFVFRDIVSHCPETHGFNKAAWPVSSPVFTSISSAVGLPACTTVLAFQRGCWRSYSGPRLLRQALQQLSHLFSLI